jgi:lysophospholipase L1-like esterase
LGRQDSVENHKFRLDGYTKFYPNEIKTTFNPDTGERIHVSINKQGFRGKDFTQEKPPNVIRVLTLGASSTFGYYDKDYETYPFQLEELLNAKCGKERHFEVINYAIPHATSHNIAAMFAAEGVKLAPDVVTFYEGRNDSALRRQYKTFFQRSYLALRQRLLFFAFMDQILFNERASTTDESLQLEPFSKERSRIFLDNLTTILDICRRAHIKLIVANQQASSKSRSPQTTAEREKLRGITYEQEAESISRQFEGKEQISYDEYAFLVHRRLMLDLRRWATENDVPFVDVIGALDHNRQLLLSWVHLHPDANRIVAAKFAEAILPLYCR